MRFVKTVENLFLIPQGFTRVEYLESTGTQYIDTGVKSSGSLKVELVAESKATPGSCNIFGIYSHNDDCFGILQQASTLTYAAQYRYVDVSTGRIVSNVSSPNNKITAVLDKGAFYINGNFIGSKTYYNFSSTQNLLLFALNREPGAGIIGPNPAKVWLCKIWDNDTLVRDMIPVLDNSGRPAMYDQVSGQLFYNQGTGEFTYGRQIIPVEYLESTGTQYIDTGIAGSSTLKIEMIAQKTGSSLGVYFGAGTGNNRIQAVYFSDYNNARIGNINSNLGPDSEKFDIVCDALNKNVIYNGTSYPFAYTSALTNLNIFIFTRNEGGSYADKATAKCWSFKIWDNNILVRDFIPAIDENGVGFMFDKVSGTCYLNAGTGAFTVGNPVYTSKLRLIKDTDGKVRFIQDVLPREYRPLKYLKSTGTQWIDLNFIPNNNSGFDMTGDFVQTSAAVRFGQRTAAYDRQFQLITGGENRVRLDYGTGSAQASQWPPTNTGRYNRVTLDGTTKIARIYFNNGTTEEHTFTAGNFTAENSCYLFAFNNNGTALVASNMTVKAFKLYDNGNIIRNLYPALRKSDNKPGMYDIITKQFFTNQGTGEFNYG